jgi:hypothetical protein
VAGVLGLNPNEAGVAGGEALPIASSGVVRPTGRNDKKRPVASEAKLGQGAWEIRPASGHDAETRHDTGQWSGGVMTHHTPDDSHVPAPAGPPARLFRDLEAGVLEYLW